ncbi:MAG TPA: PIG-L family deacetylase [Bryobacteraceae bacterium]|nr:PIG-L family deacetylase [Bryobacteraceae bacterium]
MRILIAVAHADDETLGCFSLLRDHSSEVHILHATDSAPRDLKYALRSGFSSRKEYLAARQSEMQTVLAQAGIPPANYHCLGLADQEAPRYWPRIRAYVEAFQADRIYTHAYEGGHPDHDAVALALAGLPNLWEFPLYHDRFGAFIPHTFLNGDPVVSVSFNDEAKRAKRALLDCFVSQQRVIDLFPIERELFRPAPVYDFTQPPHDGVLYYERRKLGWNWTEWRAATGNPLH